MRTAVIAAKQKNSTSSVRQQEINEYYTMKTARNDQSNQKYKKNEKVKQCQATKQLSIDTTEDNQNTTKTKSKKTITASKIRQKTNFNCLIKGQNKQAKRTSKANFTAKDVNRKTNFAFSQLNKQN